MKENNKARLSMFLIATCIMFGVINLMLGTVGHYIIGASDLVAAFFLIVVLHFTKIPAPPRLGRWLSNIYNPYLPDAERYLTYSISAYQNGGNAMKREWQAHLDWINEHLVGPPEKTHVYSVKELVKEGMVGVYAKP